MGWAILVLVVATTVWAAFDAKRRDLGATSHGPLTAGGYVVGMVLLWIVFFPLYLYQRRKAPLLTAAVPVASTSPGPEAPRFKTCPDCAETILAEANVCKHCHYRFDEANVAEEPR
jgi:hypothetical protein